MGRNRCRDASNAAGLAATALVVVALAGCGGSGGNSSATPASSAQTSTASSDAKAWAKSFCADAQAWKSSLAKSKAAFKAASSASGFNAALDSAKNANLTFRAQLARLGPPPTPNGTQAQQTVQSYAGQLRVDTQTLSGEFQQSASGASAVKQKAQSIGLTLKAMEDTLQRAYTQLTNVDESTGIGQALKSTPECTSLFGS